MPGFSSGVGGGLGDEVAANDGGSAETEEGGHDVEATDEGHGPNDAMARGLGVGNGPGRKRRSYSRRQRRHRSANS